jgi:hypothetical protein
MLGRVQDCGCIALPEDLQQRTGLFPGATFEINLDFEGHCLLLRPTETREKSQPVTGAQCSTPSSL